MFSEANSIKIYVEYIEVYFLFPKINLIKIEPNSNNHSEFLDYVIFIKQFFEHNQPDLYKKIKFHLVGLSEIKIKNCKTKKRLIKNHISLFAVANGYKIIFPKFIQDRIANSKHTELTKGPEKLTFLITKDDESQYCFFLEPLRNRENIRNFISTIENLKNSCENNNYKCNSYYNFKKITFSNFD